MNQQENQFVASGKTNQERLYTATSTTASKYSKEKIKMEVCL